MHDYILIFYGFPNLMYFYLTLDAIVFNAKYVDIPLCCISISICLNCRILYQMSFNIKLLTDCHSLGSVGFCFMETHLTKICISYQQLPRGANCAPTDGELTNWIVQVLFPLLIEANQYPSSEFQGTGTPPMPLPLENKSLLGEYSGTMILITP